jgi:hypothetical protein
MKTTQFTQQIITIKNKNKNKNKKIKKVFSTIQLPITYLHILASLPEETNKTRNLQLKKINDTNHSRT